MNREIFIKIFNYILNWNLKSKEEFKLGIDLSEHDKNLYNAVFELMHIHFNDAQINFFIWSIFDEERKLDIDNETKIIINTAEDCWEYINKLEETEENEK